MRKSFIYILSLGLMVMVTGFLYSPYYSLNKISMAVKNNELELLQQQINVPEISEITALLLRAELKLKMKIEGRKDYVTAMTDYSFALGFVDKVVASLLTPLGFPDLVAGKLDYIDPLAGNLPPDDLFENIDVEFDSLISAHFFMPQTDGLQTRVLLKRTGLFNWQIDSLDFPANEMLQQFVTKLEAAQ